MWIMTSYLNQIQNFFWRIFNVYIVRDEYNHSLSERQRADPEIFVSVSEYWKAEIGITYIRSRVWGGGGGL